MKQKRKMGCIASKNAENGNIELKEVEVQESENVLGLTKRQRCISSNCLVTWREEIQSWKCGLFTLETLHYINYGRNQKFSWKQSFENTTCDFVVGDRPTGYICFSWSICEDGT